MGRRLRVYIAGPITKGDLLGNIRQADDAFFGLMRAGLAPLCPQWSVFAGGSYKVFSEYDDVRAEANRLPQGTTHADWMGVDLPWVEVSDAVLRLPGESKGADDEVAHAESCAVPVFYSVDDVIAWASEEPDVLPFYPMWQREG